MTTTTGVGVTTATTPTARRYELTSTQLWVALASVFAGGIHLAVTPEHLEHWWVYGTFFVVTGLFQVAFAGWVLRWPTWPVALTGIVVNLAIVLVWVASRTTGLPITPPEDITSHEGTHATRGRRPRRPRRHRRRAGGRLPPRDPPSPADAAGHRQPVARHRPGPVGAATQRRAGLMDAATRLDDRARAASRYGARLAVAAVALLAVLLLTALEPLRVVFGEHEPHARRRRPGPRRQGLHPAAPADAGRPGRLPRPPAPRPRRQARRGPGRPDRGDRGCRARGRRERPARAPGRPVEDRLDLLRPQSPFPAMPYSSWGTTVPSRSTRGPTGRSRSTSSSVGSFSPSESLSRQGVAGRRTGRRNPKGTSKTSRSRCRTPPCREEVFMGTSVFALGHERAPGRSRNTRHVRRFGTGAPGMTLQRDVSSGLVISGNMATVRALLTSTAPDTDAALFSGARPGHDITVATIAGEQIVTVVHTGGTAPLKVTGATMTSGVRSGFTVASDGCSKVAPGSTRGHHAHRRFRPDEHGDDAARAGHQRRCVQPGLRSDPLSLPARPFTTTWASAHDAHRRQVLQPVGELQAHGGGAGDQSSHGHQQCGRRSQDDHTDRHGTLTNRSEAVVDLHPSRDRLRPPALVTPSGLTDIPPGNRTGG